MEKIDLTANKSAITNLLKAVDLGEPGAIDRFFSPDYVDHSPSESRGHTTDLSGAKSAFQRLTHAFPDFCHTVDDIVAEGDRVAARISASGTHQRELFGLQPTGKRISQTNIAIYRLSDGKIRERWSYQQPSILSQLGIDEEDRTSVGDKLQARHLLQNDLPANQTIPGASFWSVSLNDVMLTFFELQPYCVFEEHHHRSEQITLVLTGKLEFKVGSETFTVQPGEVMALPSNIPHSVHVLDEPTTAIDAWSPPRTL